eukprot:XP_001704197.1 Hypothetical protein GL50803_37779 [Giardia lamblia ATCC 50803]
MGKANAGDKCHEAEPHEVEPSPDVCCVEADHEVCYGPIYEY